MKFRTGILLDSFGLPFEEALTISADLGVDGIQMFAVPHHMAVLDLDYNSARSIRKTISSFGLEISALCGDIGGHGFELDYENPAKIVKTKEIIDFAVELGTEIITTHIGVIAENDNMKNDNMREALHRICRYAEQSGIYIAVETGPERSEVLNRFIIETGEKHLKVNFDPANLVMVQGENPAEAVMNLKDHIVYTHAKDGRMNVKCDPVVIYNAFAENNPDNIDIDDYFVELPLGTGEVNFPEYLKALEEIGYTGYLTIEREAGSDRIKDIREGVRFLIGVML